jgi:hypothetical protein
VELIVASKRRITALAFCPISEETAVHFQTSMHGPGHSPEAIGILAEWNLFLLSLRWSDKSKIMLRD